MSSKWMNAGLVLALSTLLFAGGAVAQDKTSDQPNVEKQEGAQTNEQEAAHETETQSEGAPALAKQCQDLALQEDDAAEKMEGLSIYETNASDYQEGETYELTVDLLGEGNAKYNLTCQVDADGNMTYEGMGKSTSVKS